MERKLEPQPHGGALARDGSPGNKGGGRPKDKIRALAAEGGNKAVKRIIKLLEADEKKTLDKPLTVQDLRGCADVLLKYGIGTQQEVTQVVEDDAILTAQLDAAIKWAEDKGLDSDSLRVAMLEAVKSVGSD